MYKQCRTEQSAARQRALEQGLMETMMNCHYDEITVSDLCEYMQIPRKSFYRYFSNKEGALHALIDHALMDFDSFTLESTEKGEKLPAAEELPLLCTDRYSFCPRRTSRTWMLPLLWPNLAALDSRL